MRHFGSYGLISVIGTIIANGDFAPALAHVIRLLWVFSRHQLSQSKFKLKGQDFRINISSRRPRVMFCIVSHYLSCAILDGGGLCRN